MKVFYAILRSVKFILWSNDSMGCLKEESDMIGATFQEATSGRIVALT